MKRYFNIVHFVPNPISGGRIPVGAIVRKGKSVQIAVAEHIPGPECVGGAKTARLLKLLVDDLQRLTRPSEIYQHLGPQIFVDEGNDIPEDVDDAVGWVQRYALPRRSKEKREPSGVRRPTRYSEGKRFLEHHGVGRYVRRTFKPEKFLGETAHQLQHLAPISQWVLGSNELLLMEPLIPRRPSWRDDLTKINTRCSAYRYHVQNGLNGHRSELFVYLLPGGDRAQRREINETLNQTSAVIDGENSGKLQSFIDRIRTVGDQQNLLSS